MATFRTTQYTADPLNPMFTTGKKLTTVQASETITAAENSNGDVWVLSGPHSLDHRIARIIGASPAFTSANDNDLGFYTIDESGAFVEVDKDIIWDGVDLSSALTHRDLLTTLNTSLNVNSNIGDLLGISNEEGNSKGYYLCLTMNTASSAVTETFHWDILVEHEY